MCAALSEHTSAKNLRMQQEFDVRMRRESNKNESVALGFVVRYDFKRNFNHGETQCMTK